MRVSVRLGCLALLVGCAAPSEPPPNLLLVTIDTLRADRLACYGGPAGADLCALFEQGVRFRWAFSAAPYTAPSVASLLTSRYPAYHGVTQSALSYLGPDDVTVAEVLAEAGYTTAAFVSNPVLERRRHLGQGFEVYDQHMTRRERNRPGFLEREAASTTDAALAWAQVAIREPWFLWVHYQDPHGPYDPPDSRPRRDPPGDERLPVLDIQSGFGGIPAYQALPGTFTRRAYERRYADEIEYLTPHLQRLVRGLEALGRAPEILLTSDHGEAFGEDGYFFAHGHSTGLDQIRVPLLHRPAVPAGPGRVVDVPVSLLDVAPTLLALAGQPIPERFQGRPLPIDALPEAASEPRAFFAEHGRRAAVVHGTRFYSRDRRAFDEGARRRELGQEMPYFPPRSATLAGEVAPDYDVFADAESLPAAEEQALSDFLFRTQGLKGLRHEDVPPEVLDRMRALGYVEE